MSMMDFLLLPVILLLAHDACSQTITLAPSSTTVTNGTDTVITCSVSDVGSSPTFLWRDDAAVPNAVTIIVQGGSKSTLPKYTNFDFSFEGTTSTMTISDIQVENIGTYTCEDIGNSLTASPAAGVAVEVNSSLTMTFTDIQDDTVTVQCDSVGGRPQIDITWLINDDQVSETPTVTNPPNSDSDLSNTRSVLVYEGSPGDSTIACEISGHNVTELNYRVTENLYAPDSSITFEYSVSDDIEVCCNIQGDQGQPEANYFYIYNEGTLVHQSGTGDNCGNIALPDEAAIIPISGVAGNYLGNITGTDSYSYQPPSTINPTTEPTGGTTAFTEDAGDSTGSTTSAATESDTTDSTGGGPNIGGIIGGVVGALVGVTVMIIIVICVIKKKDKDSGKSSGSGGSYHNNKPSQPVESTVTTKTEEETESAPQAAPRTQVQHTVTSSGDEYAMVEKKGSGGGGLDYSDTGPNGQGQTDPGLHYADLDMDRGHTDQHIPQNPAEITVYSSIVV